MRLVKDYGTISAKSPLHLYNEAVAGSSSEGGLQAQSHNP